MAKENKKDIFNYEAAPESTGHVHIKEKYDLFINNKWTKPQPEEYFDTINPANEKRISSVARANEKDVEQQERPFLPGQNYQRMKGENTYIALQELFKKNLENLQ